jgi:homoserine dehydrogenase
LIDEDSILENVNGVMNAVAIKGDAIGETLLYGPGAGMNATASAVVGDLVDAVRTLTTDPNNRVPYLAFQSHSLSNVPILTIDKCESAFYLRLKAYDKPGVLAKITMILADYDINIESIMQHEDEEQAGIVPIVILTHPVIEGKMLNALEAFKKLEVVLDDIVKIRVEL